MKIISYNVNGIRAALKKGFADWLKEVSPDVLCLQETKAMASQLDTSVFDDLGYKHYWHSAQKKGYSGVAILTKEKVLNFNKGIGIENIDFEGRVIRVDLKAVSIISLYLPSGTNINRLKYKFKFMDEFQSYINNLKKNYQNLAICGDYNICHQAIDIHDPIRNKNVSGFLPKEREWIDKFIKCGFIDSFRYLNSEAHQYSWWSYRANARNNNKGWRIDYNMVSENLKNNIKRTYLLPDALHSDHCPVVLELDFK